MGLTGSRHLQRVWRSVHVLPTPWDQKRPRIYLTLGRVAQCRCSAQQRKIPPLVVCGRKRGWWTPPHPVGRMAMSFEYSNTALGHSVTFEDDMFEEHWLGCDSTLLSSVWNLIDLKFIDHYTELRYTSFAIQAECIGPGRMYSSSLFGLVHNSITLFSSIDVFVVGFDCLVDDRTEELPAGAP